MDRMKAPVLWEKQGQPRQRSRTVTPQWGCFIIAFPLATSQGREIIMEIINVELTFEEIELLVESMENTVTPVGAVDITATPAFKKLLSRLQTIDNAHTVMSVAATYDDNPNPFHKSFVEAGKNALEESDSDLSLHLSKEQFALLMAFYDNARGRKGTRDAFDECDLQNDAELFEIMQNTAQALEE